MIQNISFNTGIENTRVRPIVINESITATDIELYVYNIDNIFILKHTINNVVLSLNSAGQRVLNIDLQEILQSYGLPTNTYNIKIFYGFSPFTPDLLTKFGILSFTNQFISEISSDNREVIIGADFTRLGRGSLDPIRQFPIDIQPSDSATIQVPNNDIITRPREGSFVEYLLNIIRIPGTNADTPTLRPLYLNVGNTYTRVINILFLPININNTLPRFVLKLGSPLPDTINEYDNCRLIYVENEVDVQYNFTETITLPEQTGIVLDPNFNIDISTTQTTELPLSSIDDILNSKSLSDVNKFTSSFNKISSRYYNFDKFITFSSAKFRVDIFKNKIEQIEVCNTKLINLSGSGQTTDIIQVIKERNAIIESFDGFESYLYYDTTSGSRNIDPWPKTSNGSLTWVEQYNVDSGTIINVTGSGYILLPISSIQVNTYLESLYAKATQYDSDNVNNIIKSIPENIILDRNNSNYIVFTSMIAHVIDNNMIPEFHMSDITSLISLKSDILNSIISSNGWEVLYNSNADDVYNIELQSRLVSTLDLFKQTKGTINSIKSLFNIYGIPTSLINIYEFIDLKSPSNINQTREYVADSYISNYIDDGALVIRFGAIPTTNLFFVFRPTKNEDILFSHNTFSIKYNRINNSYGELLISNDNFITVDTVIQDIPLWLFENDCKSICIDTNNNELTICVTHRDKVLFKQTVSITNTLQFESPNECKLTNCDLFDIRLYTTSITHMIETYTRDFRIYGIQNGDVFNELIGYWPIHTGNIYTSRFIPFSEVIPSQHPNQDLFINIQANELIVDTNSELKLSDLQLFSLKPITSLLQSNHDPIIIADTQFTSTYVTTNDEVIEIDGYDTNDLQITLSPSQLINKDIENIITDLDLENMLFTRLSDLDSHTTYRTLDQILLTYKQFNPNFILSNYLNLVDKMDTNFFEFINKLIPLKANYEFGVEIKSPIIYRNKHKTLSNIELKSYMYDSDIISLIDTLQITATNFIYDALVKSLKTFTGSKYTFSNITYDPVTNSWNITFIAQPVRNVFVGTNRLSTFKQRFVPIYDTETDARIIIPSKINSFFTAAEVQDYQYISAAFIARNYTGCKISAPTFNAPSLDLSSRLPVVEILSSTPERPPSITPSRPPRRLTPIGRRPVDSNPGTSIPRVPDAQMVPVIPDNPIFISPRQQIGGGNTIGMTPQGSNNVIGFNSPNITLNTAVQPTQPFTIVPASSNQVFSAAVTNFIPL